MLTADGPCLLEFNVRFGDPETQVLLPGMAVALAPLLAAAAVDRLAEAAHELGIQGSLMPASPGSTVGVVLAARGYPATPGSGRPDLRDRRSTGDRGAGLLRRRAETPGAELLTGGGRVITVVGPGPDLDAAAAHAYEAADRIAFSGRQMRRDIGRAASLAGAAA